MNQHTQQAPITLSRQTLERLQMDLHTLTVEEAEDINQALEAMKLNDQLEPVKSIPNPKGTFSHTDVFNLLYPR